MQPLFKGDLCVANEDSLGKWNTHRYEHVAPAITLNTPYQLFHTTLQNSQNLALTPATLLGTCQVNLNGISLHCTCQMGSPDEQTLHTVFKHYKSVTTTVKMKGACNTWLCLLLGRCVTFSAGKTPGTFGGTSYLFIFEHIGEQTLEIIVVIRPMQAIIQFPGTQFSSSS